MLLILKGHSYKYAIEQSMLAYFPEEKPTYEDKDSKNRAVVSLSKIANMYIAHTSLHVDGKRRDGFYCTISPSKISAYDLEGRKQRTVKLSFFRAYCRMTGQHPVWGALTGVRPGKLAAKYLSQGYSQKKTDSVLRKVYCVSKERRWLCIESAKQGLAAKESLKPNEISLYVGIPFCPTRCAYCSFVSQAVHKSLSLMDPYVDALCCEIEEAGAMVKKTGLSVKTFYMGGGTPTTLSSGQMDRVLSSLENAFDFSSVSECCVEAGRPDTITREKLQVLLNHGINRISINPQTLEDRVLENIGRKHTAKDIADSMDLAMSMGFQHINMDLIAGLSSDSFEGFKKSLDGCIGMGADNITVHTLSLKNGSRITTEKLSVPGPDVVAEMLDYALSTLPVNGFHPYYLYRQKYMSGSFENVGWCKQDAQCLYNILIMEELHSILSLGAGGSTKMVDQKTGKIERLYHAKYPEEYLQQREKISANLQAFADFHLK